MKNTFYAIFLALTILSCGPSDKKAQLDKLKIQHDQLANQIAQLEAEINPSGRDGETKSVPVKILPAQRGVFTHFIEVQGVVDGDQNVAVSPQSAGIVTAVYVTEGSSVKKGQVMAELDAAVLKQSLDELRTQAEFANNLYLKQKALWDKNIGSEVQYLQAKTTKEGLDKKLVTLQEQINMSKVISPISGTVESVPLRVGQMASPGMPNSVIRVINMNAAKIKAEVSENFAARIKNGNQAIVRFPDLNQEVESTLNFASRFIDPTNRTFQIECKIKSGQLPLRANMIAYVKVKDYVNENVFSVPVNLVQTNREGDFIAVATQKGKDWVASRKMIKKGMDYNGIAEILEGLSDGDKIITAGFQGLNQGALITF